MGNFVKQICKHGYRINHLLAKHLWQVQKKIVTWLLDYPSPTSIVLGCGIAGVIYAKKSQQQGMSHQASQIESFFTELSHHDITSILENQNLYSFSFPDKERIRLHHFYSQSEQTHALSSQQAEALLPYWQKKVQEQNLSEEFLQFKSDKQQNRDKEQLHHKKKQLQQVRQELSQICQQKVQPVVAELLENPNATLVTKKLDLYLPRAEKFLDTVNSLKEGQALFALLQNSQQRQQLSELANKIRQFAEQQLAYLQTGKLSSLDAEKVIQQNNFLLDAAWALEKEILEVIEYVTTLFQIDSEQLNEQIFQQGLAIASVLRGLDKKMETRGRDSCGLSVMVKLPQQSYQKWQDALKQENEQEGYQKRIQTKDLANYAIDQRQCDFATTVTFTYKVAKAVGQLGDNVRDLRKYIAQDRILALALQQPVSSSSLILHTRWASQGVVSIANCHPVDNKGVVGKQEKKLATGHIYAALNGDIDNHLELRQKYESNDQGLKVSSQITTDAKIIPLTIDYYINEGHSLEQAFLKAVNEFRGSFAIEMHSDLEPGKIYLAQQGKGQGLYVGISPYGYHIASEIYGFVEQTPVYLPMEPGQVFVVNEESEGGVENIRAFDFQGNPLVFSSDKDLSRTPITTRDIFLDTTQYGHFLEKEIHEAPEIIEKTLRGKWEKNSQGELQIKMGEEILPSWVKNKMAEKKYRKFLFLGMGTAHAAAEAVAANFSLILPESLGFQFATAIATEFTANYQKRDRSDTLVIAISQSGGTTDTNAAVRKLAEDDADILAIVNKRDSDMTFLVDGILYTGDGRDVEIAVASTKAFYAQVVAGTLYALAFAEVLQLSEGNKVTEILSELLQTPQVLQQLFGRKERIAHSAHELAPKHIYWDTLSTGIGYPVAKEIKIKLSELCYMSIPEFLAANKKHVNLSAEAMILCFFGALQDQRNSRSSSLSKDLQGEISIFLAQDNTPIVFTTEDDTHFDEIIPEKKKQTQLLNVLPAVSPYLCVVVNTAAGHLWSYYAAKALNERAEFISQTLERLVEKENLLKSENKKPLEIIADRRWQTVIRSCYQEYSKLVAEGRFNNGFSAERASRVERFFLCAMGVIPVSAVPLLFGDNWGGERLLQEFKVCLSTNRTWLTRSIDAIKHQAKYITVGVTGFEGVASMPSGKLKELFYTFIKEKCIQSNQEDVNEYDLNTLSNVQKGIAAISGALMYRVSEENSKTYIETIAGSRLGNSEEKASRYENKAPLKGGRKAMAILNDKVHLGKDYDESNVLVIPVRSLGRISKLIFARFLTNEQLSGEEKIELLGDIDTKRSKAEEIFTILIDRKEEIIQKQNMASDLSDREFFAQLLEMLSVEDLLTLSHEELSETILEKTIG